MKEVARDDFEIIFEAGENNRENGRTLKQTQGYASRDGRLERNQHSASAIINFSPPSNATSLGGSALRESSWCQKQSLDYLL